MNCNVFAETDVHFSKIYDCSDHISIRLVLGCPHNEKKPPLENFRSFGSVDYNELSTRMQEKVFNPNCFTNIKIMCKDLYEYLDELIVQHVPIRSRQRQSLPPWITPSTSNLINKLKTQKRMLENKPTSYRKLQVKMLENIVTEASESDRLNYQEGLFLTRNTKIIFKLLKSLNKSPSLPKEMTSNEGTRSNATETVNMLNKFFHSVFSPKEHFRLSDIQCENPTLTTFDVSRKVIHA